MSSGITSVGRGGEYGDCEYVHVCAVPECAPTDKQAPSKVAEGTRFVILICVGVGEETSICMSTMEMEIKKVNVWSVGGGASS